MTNAFDEAYWQAAWDFCAKHNLGWHASPKPDDDPRWVKLFDWCKERKMMHDVDRFSWCTKDGGFVTVDTVRNTVEYSRLFNG